MADSRVSNVRKKELEQIDPFQENLLKAMVYAKKHKKILLIIISTIICVALLITGVSHRYKKNENKAAFLVSQALSKYTKADNLVSGYEQSIQDFEILFAKYPKTKSGKLARIQFAQICYKALKFNQSYEQYTKALELFEDKASLKNFLLSSLGHTSIVLNKLDEAKQYFEQISADNKDLLKDEAQFILAILDQTDKENSKKLLSKIVSKYNNSIYKPLAQDKINK